MNWFDGYALNWHWGLLSWC